jgi:hypothetical protein
MSETLLLEPYFSIELVVFLVRIQALESGASKLRQRTRTRDAATRAWHDVPLLRNTVQVSPCASVLSEQHPGLSVPYDYSLTHNAWNNTFNNLRKCIARNVERR